MAASRATTGGRRATVARTGGRGQAAVATTQAAGQSPEEIAHIASLRAVLPEELHAVCGEPASGWADATPRELCRGLVLLREAVPHGDVVPLLARFPGAALAGEPDEVAAFLRDVELRAPGLVPESFGRAERRRRQDAAANATFGALLAGTPSPGRTKAKAKADADHREQWGVGGTLKGVATRDQDVVARFWNLWGGRAECRLVLKGKPKDSIFRNPQRMEARLLDVDKFVPFLDVPMVMHREPLLFEQDTQELVRRIACLRETLAAADVSGLLSSCPSLLLAAPGTLRAAVAELEAEERRAGLRGDLLAARVIERVRADPDALLDSAVIASAAAA